jgi:hypothetical protein
MRLPHVCFIRVMLTDLSPNTSILMQGAASGRPEAHCRQPKHAP